jgi:hypothetical protein
MKTPISSTPMPSEESSVDETAKAYNPLGTAVDEKPYSLPGNQFSQQQLATDLAEPTFLPPPMTDDEIPVKEGAKINKDKDAKDKKPEPKAFNPDMNELNDSDKSKAAEQMAVYGVNLYEQIHVFGNEMLKIPEKKVNKLTMEGQIDLSVAVPYDMDQSITLGEFLKEYNTQCSDVLTVDKDFKEAIIPPLTRILAKRGHGMSDEQTVLFMIAQHASVSAFKFISMKSQLKSVLEFAKEHTINQRKGGMRPTMSVVPPVPQQQSAPDYEAPIVHMDVPAQPMTLQEKALAAHGVNQSVDPGLPVYGGQNKLTTMDNIYKAEQKEAAQKAKINLSNAKKRIKKSNAGGSDAAPTGAKKRAGRPRKNPSLGD